MKIVLTLLLFSSYSSAKESTVLLNEVYLKKLIQENPPSVQQIEASFLNVKREQLSTEDKFAFTLQGKGEVYKSKERLLNGFDAVTTSATNYSLGIVKPTRYGVNVGVETFGNKAANIFVPNGATTVGASVSLSVDLFKNFLGRQTDNTLRKSNLSVKRAKLEKKSSLKTFESNIRKLYWSLVANREQKKLLKSLTKTAEKQYWESVKRKKSGVADSGEVARFRSQWTTRKANLLALNYREGETLKSLKELLPALNGKKVDLAPYSVEETVKDVLTCTAQIDSYIKAPFQHTVYDEIVAILEKEERLERKIIDTYDAPELKLTGQYSTVGRDFSFEDARDNFYDDSRPRTSLALEFSMPLGKSKRKTEEVTKLLNKNRYTAEARANLSKINAFHTETVYLVNTLREVVKNQKDTNRYVGESLKVSRKKYRQARIGLQELISEQDTLLQSQLNEIDSNLTIINTLIDYFSIYMDIPCAFNKI